MSTFKERERKAKWARDNRDRVRELNRESRTRWLKRSNALAAARMRRMRARRARRFQSSLKQISRN